MARKNLAIALLVSTSLIMPGSFATAQPGKEKNAGKERAGSGERGKGHKHAQKNARNLLGDKIKKNGKHILDRLANRDVTADVRNGKVASMAAGDLPMKRVITKKKMAMIDSLIIPVAWTGAQLAQSGGYSDYNYGYCFDDGYEYTCYWYPAEDVYYSEYSWDDYDPYY